MSNNDSMMGRAAKYAEVEVEPQEVPAEELGDIHVKVDPPEMGTARCVTLSANNPWLPILGQDPTRKSAVLLAVDNDVYVTSSKEIAMELAGSTTGTDGFYLPAGIAIPVDNQSAYWVACTTTATSTRVSVLVSRDDA